MNDLNRLKVVLVEKKRTSKWLAEQLDKNPTTVSKWCTNTIQPDLHTLNQIATLLEVDIRTLLTSNIKLSPNDSDTSNDIKYHSI